MKISPVNVRYLHLTIKFAMLLKKGMTERYANLSVITIESNIACIVNTRLTRILSRNNLVVSRCVNAEATFMGRGISPFEFVCHKSSAMITCAITMMVKFCLLIFANGSNIFFIVVCFFPQAAGTRKCSPRALAPSRLRIELFTKYDLYTTVPGFSSFCTVVCNWLG